MACLVSISFSSPLRPPQTIFMKNCLENSAPSRLSYKATVRTATNQFAPCSSTGTFSDCTSSKVHRHVHERVIGLALVYASTLFPGPSGPSSHG